MLTKQKLLSAALLTTIFLTACADSKLSNKTIPTENPVSIEDAAKILDVSQSDFESYLSDIGYTYDDYIFHLTGLSKTLEDEKNSLEEQYGCTFDEYIKTVMAVYNDNTPDSDIYVPFESKYSSHCAFIPRSELNEACDMLINFNISCEIADESNDAYVFDVISACNGDFATYMSAVNNYSGCTSLSLTNMTLFGSYGVKKPDEDNACMDKLFCYDDKTDDILEVIVMPVITLHYEDESKNTTLALSNNLGLIFKTTGTDCYEKMLKLSSLDFQIRNVDTIADNTKNQ